ncbi:hypothetical protein TIFTF001_003040 [Ficus carica]|uniref:Uncharacterized protein n=1 Tax=Ficus carica TaxID=3494 RepID=A0AA88CQL0_FICCA|nr:hypothetical protein TIFTF001_003040 [Ficus carica]
MEASGSKPPSPAQNGEASSLLGSPERTFSVPFLRWTFLPSALLDICGSWKGLNVGGVKTEKRGKRQK